LKILIIEDSERLRRSLSDGLKKLNYCVDLAADGEQGLQMAKLGDYQTIILDLMLPKLDGLSVLRKLRQSGSEANILILSARDLLNDRVKGLELGADDYLVKPFAFEELCARITAISRRHFNLKDPVIRIDNIEIDTSRKQVFCAGVEIHLTASEYGVLECLVFQRGRTLSKDQLLNWLYDMNTSVTSNVIEVLLSSMRRKLRAAGAVDIIQTRRGFGYTIL